uniref:Cation:proton antiporter n=1 Tax=Pseudoponticoccus marisrubri TaxID=1685382 RepID=A0A0W7WJA6_9RHOB|nr:Na+/H+ antiporter subunit G [Pseudoponticoccus marisrubri]KUF10596.1 cation:proton antiporter [Pseudoponticoccus marisrubri]
MLAEIVISAFLVIGGIFGLVGSYGLLKLRDCMQRLHAPTKASTVGVGSVLIASMLYFLLVKGQVSFHEVMITLFLFLTAPITAHFMAQVHVRLREREDDLPETDRDFGWSIYEDPPVYGDGD